MGVTCRCAEPRGLPALSRASLTTIALAGVERPRKRCIALRLATCRFIVAKLLGCWARAAMWSAMSSVLAGRGIPIGAVNAASARVSQA